MRGESGGEDIFDLLSNGEKIERSREKESLKA